MSGIVKQQINRFGKVFAILKIAPEVQSRYEWENLV
jgi:hypothetical protein